MQVSAAGFSAVSQPAVTLQVGQTATSTSSGVGAYNKYRHGNRRSPALETSTSELGT